MFKWGGRGVPRGVKARGWEAEFLSWQILAKQREHLKSIDERATKEAV